MNDGDTTFANYKLRSTKCLKCFYPPKKFVILDKRSCDLVQL